MLFDNRRQTRGIINSEPLSLNAPGIWWLSLPVHIRCSSTSMGSSFYRLDIVLHLPRVSVIFLLPKKVKKRKNESRVKWLLCFFFFFFETTNNQKLKEGIKKKKKMLRSIMISLDSAVSLISDDASALSRTVWSCSWVGGGGRGQFWRESPRVESLELHDSARTPAARASGRGVQVGWCFISVCLNNSASPVAFKAAYLTCLFTPRNNTERRYGGIFFFLRNMKSV